jgi:hypothetical protein
MMRFMARTLAKSEPGAIGDNLVHAEHTRQSKVLISKLSPVRAHDPMTPCFVGPAPGVQRHLCAWLVADLAAKGLDFERYAGLGGYCG